MNCWSTEMADFVKIGLKCLNFIKIVYFSNHDHFRKEIILLIWTLQQQILLKLFYLNLLKFAVGRLRKICFFFLLQDC